ncbi:hypothetical protein ABTX82_34295 [Streptomyces lavendulae]|uniref:hypothetical protein n=1 Tax=Streptomyces lavendulae TaxID=1914 RepID=UPI003327DD15
MIKRLRQNGVQIEPVEKAQITVLASERNKLQHFGATLNAAEVETRAGVVLEFLLRFIDEYPADESAAELEAERVAGDVRRLHAEMKYVRDRLPHIRGYTTAKTTRLQPDLAALKRRTLCCPDCGAHTPVEEAYLADAPDKQRAFCFSCSQAFESPDNCIRCTLPFKPRAGDDLVCGSCRAQALARV